MGDFQTIRIVMTSFSVFIHHENVNPDSSSYTAYLLYTEKLVKMKMWYDNPISELLHFFFMQVNEYRDGIKIKGDKIGMPCIHSTVI